MGPGFAALSKHAGGAGLHNSFPISCALQGLLSALAAKCNVSPLTGTPAAQLAVTQLAVTQPAALPGRPAIGCIFPGGWGWDLSFPTIESSSPHLHQRRVPVLLPSIVGLSMQARAGRHLPAAQGKSVRISPCPAQALSCSSLIPSTTKQGLSRSGLKKPHKYPPIAAPSLPPVAPSPFSSNPC